LPAGLSGATLRAAALRLSGGDNRQKRDRQNEGPLQSSLHAEKRLPLGRNRTAEITAREAKVR
jgi:hypothetical protein